MSIRRVAFMLVLMTAGISAPVASQGWPNPIPLWASGLDPLTRQFYYGCAAVNPSVCIYGAIGRMNDTSMWTLYLQPETYDEAGTWWQTYDIWGGYTSDFQCTFGDDIFVWQEENCQVQRRGELTLNGALDWVGPPYERIFITLKPIPTPEPTTLALLAPALLGVGAIARRRERTGKDGGV